MAPPDISIIIPVYNRGELIRYTLDSVARSRQGLDVQVIVVDDGSEFPIAESLHALGFKPEILVRQQNQGLLFARLAGLNAATGRYVLFLDSDDFITPDKLRLHVSAMDGQRADVSYSDSAELRFGPDGPIGTPIPNEPVAETESLPEVLLWIQPAPHGPVFRTEWLQRCVASPLFPPTPYYNPVAEIWFYHIGSVVEGTAVKVPGAHTIVGHHEGARLTNHWEKLGVASLAVMEAFARTCPIETAVQQYARRLVGRKALAAWRRLARGTPAEFERRLLNVWERLASDEEIQTGGPLFRTLAHIVGVPGAAKLLRRFQTPTYNSCRTMSDAEFVRLLHGIPPPAPSES